MLTSNVRLTFKKNFKVKIFLFDLDNDRNHSTQDLTLKFQYSLVTLQIFAMLFIRNMEKKTKSK